MKGIIGKFFFQFGVTISVAVLISLLEALTLAPMRCSRFLEVGERRGRLGQAVDRALRPAVRAPTCARWSPPCTTAAWCWRAPPSSSWSRSVIVPAAAQEFVPAQDTQQLPGPLPDAGGHQPRRRPRPSFRQIEAVPARTRGEVERLLRLHRRLRRRRGQHRDAVRDHEGAAASARADPKAGPPPQPAGAHGRGARASSAPSPACAPSLHRPLAAGLQRQPRRRLPDRAHHPRPRLGRSSPGYSRQIMEEMRAERPGHRRGQRLPGGHARGAGGPRPQQGGRPRHQHGRHRRRPSTRPSAARASASSRKAAGASTSACACSARSASGRRTSSACYVRTGSGRPGAPGRPRDASSSSPRCRPSRARTASAPSPSSPTWPRAPRRRTPSTASQQIARARAARRLPRDPLRQPARPSRSRSTRCSSPSCWA